LTDDRACGADDVVGACPGQMLRKLRFLMTDYSQLERLLDQCIQQFIEIEYRIQPVAQAKK
jgi:hypothetical protein